MSDIDQMDEIELIRLVTVPDSFLRLLRVYATKSEIHANTLAARAEKKGKRNGKIEARMASNIHTSSLLLREAAKRIEEMLP